MPKHTQNKESVPGWNDIGRVVAVSFAFILGMLILVTGLMQTMDSVTLQ